MNKKIRTEIVGDVMTGLAVAALVSAAAPTGALAQTLANVGTNAQIQIMDPFIQFASYVAYALGTILLVAGIAAAKKHADNPTGAPLAQALGRLGAGTAFLAAPAVASMLLQTSTALGVTGTKASFTAIGTF